MGPLSGWPTLLIAMVVAAIAYLQWRTARNKLALDLFEKRFQVFMDVRLIVSVGGVDRIEKSFSDLLLTGEKQFDVFFDRGLPNEILARGRFLFGSDVVELLKKVHSLVVKVETNDRRASGELDRLFKDEIIPAFERYMKFETRPLLGWF